jgi:hypothetical protein
MFKKEANSTKMLISLHDTLSQLTTFTRNALDTVNIYGKYEEKKFTNEQCDICNSFGFTIDLCLQ